MGKGENWSIEDTLSGQLSLREKLSNFDYNNKSYFQCNTQSLKVSPEVPFNCKLLIFGIVSAKGIGKNFPVLHRGVVKPV